ncbi:hypothetical protein [Antarcticirhabdus aurantiaca]|uniref:Uncharacterized protein n=1 Tax=Antarcticirhabdus aurantiaca TaxID=2606717 RepID=A0ACD4NPF3_9HYPH|nr:hypothetical protein [Antarcticirhabdus aurantiaca]WAJ28734.1 hypothetical protein OXU80_00315 [Jeongeuplla avenae]
MASRTERFAPLRRVLAAALIALAAAASPAAGAAEPSPASVLKRHAAAAVAGDREAVRRVAKAIVALGPQGIPSAAALRPRLRTEARLGSSASAVAYGILLQYGIGGAPAPREAPGWYARAAGAGNRSGAQRAAVAYALGWGVDRDTRKALRLLSRLEPEARAKQMVVISEAMLRPEQYEPDAAEDWLERALALETRSTLKAVTLFEGIEFNNADRSAEILAFLRGRAEAGDAKAAMHLGRRLADSGSAEERLEAARWLLAAADGGEERARQSLAALLVDARAGVGAGGPQIRALLEEQARANSPAARASLAEADAFSLGGGPVRAGNGGDFLAEAARDGDVDAQVRLGMLFLIDTTKPENAALARAYLSLAAAKGSALARSAVAPLGTMPEAEALALVRRDGAIPKS